MSAQLIQSLLPHLPRFAEEQGDFYSVPRADLLAALSQSVDPASAEATLGILETLLNRLAVLQSDALARGEWCFVSFPAQLLATSVLTTLGDDGSPWFAADFWNTRDIDNSKKDQQRAVLRWLEQARVSNHAGHAAAPIRYVYVAWGIIKLDGRVLFYQREDTKKRFDQAAGDYGLLGGRCNQNDVDGIPDKVALLNALQSPNSPIIKAALPQTLKRELEEEAGLRFGEHYAFKPWRSLRPYRQVQGAAPNHALTEYYLDVFRIELTLEGLVFLQQRIAQDERLVWLTLDDIERGTSDDGKIPYIQALYLEFGDDHKALTAALRELSESFVPAYRVDKKNYAITLPLAVDKPIRMGAPGKEKPLALALVPGQLQWVLGLAAHLRGFSLQSDAQRIRLHPHGWIEVLSDVALARELQTLAETLQGTDLIVEVQRERYFRLSVRPDSVYFDDALYAFSVGFDDLHGTKSKIPVSIARNAFSTGLGDVEGMTETFMLTLDLASNLIKLSEQPFSSDHDWAVKVEDAYKKGLDQDPRFMALGLRKLVHRAEGLMRFAAKCLVRNDEAGMTVEQHSAKSADCQ